MLSSVEHPLNTLQAPHLPPPLPSSPPLPPPFPLLPQTLRECTFITVAGLRGSASLIMGQAVVTEVQMFQKEMVSA